MPLTTRKSRVKVKVIRFVSPYLAKVEEGEVEEGTLRVGNKVYLLFDPNTGTYFQPIIFDRGFFGREIVYIVSDTYVFPSLAKYFENNQPVYLVQALKEAGLSDEKIDEIIQKVGQVVYVPNYVIDFEKIGFEFKENVPRFLGAVFDANFAEHINIAMKREAGKIMSPKQILSFIIVMAIAVIFSVVILPSILQTMTTH